MFCSGRESGRILNLDWWRDGGMEEGGRGVTVTCQCGPHVESLKWDIQLVPLFFHPPLPLLPSPVLLSLATALRRNMGQGADPEMSS